MLPVKGREMFESTSKSNTHPKPALITLVWCLSCSIFAHVLTSFSEHQTVLLKRFASYPPWPPSSCALPPLFLLSGRSTSWYWKMQWQGKKQNNEIENLHQNSTNAYIRSTSQKSNYVYIGSTTVHDHKLTCLQNVGNLQSRSSTMYTKALIKHVYQQVKLISSCIYPKVQLCTQRQQYHKSKVDKLIYSSIWRLAMYS